MERVLVVNSTTDSASDQVVGAKKTERRLGLRRRAGVQWVKCCALYTLLEVPVHLASREDERLAPGRC